MFYGGEKADKEWEKQIQAILKKHGAKASIKNGYGMTETSAAILIEPIWESRELLPLCNVNVKIIDTENSAIENGYDKEGELCISSDTIMLGYYKNENETSYIIFEENGTRWIKTHDLAKISPDGYITITGRIKRIYHKLSMDNIELRVYPMRIEEVISKEAKVKKCAVVGVKDEKVAYRTVAYLIIGKDANKEKIQSDLEIRCSQELPGESNQTVLRALLSITRLTVRPLPL